MQEPPKTGLIKTDLSPPEIPYTVGTDPVRVKVTVENRSREVENCTIELTGPGISSDWFRLSDQKIALFPNDVKTVTITFQPPNRADTLEGRYQYTVEIRTETKNISVPAVGILDVFLPQTLTVALQPETARGPAGRFEVLVTNRTKSRQDVKLLPPKDQADLLEYLVEPLILRLAPGDQAGSQGTMTLTVNLQADQHLTRDQPFQFTVQAQNVNGGKLSNAVTGQFTYTPAEVLLELRPEYQKGSEGHYDLDIDNRGGEAVEVEVSAADRESALDLLFNPTSVVLRPRQLRTVTLTARSQRGRRLDLRPYEFTVTARQRGRAGGAPLGRPIKGTFEFAPPPEFAVTVTPDGQPTATSNDYTIQLNNPSQIGLRLSLRSEDDGQALDLLFRSQIDQILLPPGGSHTVGLQARLRGASPTQAAKYPFRVVAHATPDDGSLDIEKAAGAELVYTPDNRKMLDMAVLPPQTSGDLGRFYVRLTSGAASPLTVVLRARDDSGDLEYTFQRDQVVVAPGAVEVVNLTVSPRRGRVLTAGQSYSFEVNAWGPGVSTPDPLRATATWTYTPPAVPVAPLSLQLDHTLIMGDVGQLQLTLTNTGNIPLPVRLEGIDEAEALEFAFQNPRVDLQPGDIHEMSMIVRGHGGAPLPGPYRYPFTIIGRVPGMDPGPASMQQGELVITDAPKRAPLWVPWQRLAMVAMLVAWIVAPFLISIVLRDQVKPWMYQVLAMMVFPLVGTAVYRTNPTHMQGWRGMLVGWLGFGSIFSVLLMSGIIPGVGADVAPFVNLILIPAIFIILLA